jgi:23S rRNA (guanosine2251-2'-O)-methyltransferase
VLVALDGVQDPHNLGALIRSAEFFGVLGLFWARDRSAGLSPAVVRASAGASERLPLAQVTNLARALATCKDSGYWILGTVPDGGSPLRTLVAQGLPDAVVVVLGGEERGLRRLTRENCDFLATIPGAGGVASLNVSAAAAVTLSDVATGLAGP